MNFRSRQRRVDTDINLTPLIDVVFLLLIFFMVTTTFSREAHIKLQLPEATSHEKAVPREKYLTILITAQGEYAVQGAADSQPRELINSSLRTLQATLQQATTTPDPIVLIRADRRTPHAAVVKAMDAARRLGFHQLLLATDHTE